MKLACLCLALMMLVSPGQADEAVIQSLFQEVRCLECGGQSIADSNTTSAQELKRLIRTEIEKGRAPDEVRALLREKYGEEILAAPVVAKHTLFLWVAPLIGLLAAALIMLKRLFFIGIRHH